MATKKKKLKVRRVKCRCGCCWFTTTLKNAVYAPHHTKYERDKLGLEHYKNKACAGMVVPDEWRVCAFCGDMFPFFKRIHIGAADLKSCPSFIKDGCAEGYRKQQRALSLQNREAPNHHREKAKRFRRWLCNKNDRPCKKYSECSDREFHEEPEERKWEYEIHGKDCYIDPGEREPKTAPSVSILGSEWYVGDILPE